MTGAIFCESRPATIIKSAWRGDGRKTSEPNRATSKREADMDIISMAQQARPKLSGQMELLRAQFTALSSVVKMMPSSSRRLPKSSGLVSVACLPSDVLMVSRPSYFRTARLPRQIARLLRSGVVSDDAAHSAISSCAAAVVVSSPSTAASVFGDYESEG